MQSGSFQERVMSTTGYYELLYTEEKGHERKTQPIEASDDVAAAQAAATFLGNIRKLISFRYLPTGPSTPLSPDFVTADDEN